MKTLKWHTLIFSTLLSLVMVVSFSLPTPVVAQDDSSMGEMRKKRYRYRKRKHRVQLDGFIIPWSSESKRKLSFDLNGVYAYNAGYFELGPYLNVYAMDNSSRNINLNLKVGGLIEGNFIKNTRKKRFVPGIGLKLGYWWKEKKDHMFDLSPYVALKYFPASRTGFILNIGYSLTTQFKNFFRSNDHDTFVSLGYVHYFHQ